MLARDERDDRAEIVGEEAENVVEGEDTHQRALEVDHGHPPDAAFLHAREHGLDVVVLSGHERLVREHVFHGQHSEMLDVLREDAHDDVSIGEDADRPPIRTDGDDVTDVLGAHEPSRLEEARVGAHRDHVAVQELVEEHDAVWSMPRAEQPERKACDRAQVLRTHFPACSSHLPRGMSQTQVSLAKWVGARLLTDVERIGQRLHVEVDGIDRLPSGRALLVANHAFGFWDLALAVARIQAMTGRPVWSLGEHLWWKVPFVREVAREVRILDGVPENADDILAKDGLLLVLPGGLRESLKPRELRYRLLWGRRFGFVRAALRNKAPIVPLACIGGDEMFDFVGDPFKRSRRVRISIPLPRPLHLFPFPHRASIRFVVGEPIEVEGRGSADDPRALKSLRREVEGALHEIIEEELAKRVGFDYGGSALA